MALSIGVDNIVSRGVTQYKLLSRQPTGTWKYFIARDQRGNSGPQVGHFSLPSSSNPWAVRKQW